MRKNYPEYYKGPKAGGSEDEEWLAVTEFQAFMYIHDNTWFYSDFDCWLAARDRHHYKLGGDAVHNALSQEIDKFRLALYNVNTKSRCSVEDLE